MDANERTFIIIGGIVAAAIVFLFWTPPGDVVLDVLAFIPGNIWGWIIGLALVGLIVWLFRQL